MPLHRFGGDWTEEKLRRIRDYLLEYMKIFNKNPRAKRLRTIYVDAFAGTGTRGEGKGIDPIMQPLFDDADATELKRGSVKIALECQPHFDEYIFVDLSADHVSELKASCLQYEEACGNIRIIQEDANIFLQRWCREQDWRFRRAVVFLDPYGMAVDWQTIQAIAGTEAIDLWLLFPLGQAVNRMLTKKAKPEKPWAEKLTRFFGTEDWEEEFYRPNPQLSLFDEDSGFIKDATFDSIARYFVERLKTEFPAVAENPLPLLNSKKVPIFLLCFAASNPKGAPTALRIANHLLGKKKYG